MPTGSPVSRITTEITREQKRILERIETGEVFAVERSVLVDPEHDNPMCSCGFEEGPDEACLFHGRSKLDWMNREQEALERANKAEARAEHLERELGDWRKGHERLSNRRDELLTEVEDLKKTIVARDERHEREKSKMATRIAEAQDRADAAGARAEQNLLRKQEVEILLEEMELLRDKWRRDCLVARNQRDGLARTRMGKKSDD